MANYHERELLRKLGKDETSENAQSLKTGHNAIDRRRSG